ncbi:MAG: gluconate:H+ symporter [Verrucomicrobiota bacterium]
MFDVLAVSSGLSPFAVALISIALLMGLILWLRVNAFLALLIASVCVGLLSDIPITEIAGTIQDSMGSALGFIATIIGLGSIFGKILEHSGGTEALAQSMLRFFGEKRAPWAMVLTGFLVSIPVFLDAGLVILIPIIYALTRESGKPILHFGIPLLAGMAVTHSFVPPTPGPIAVAQQLGADLGLVILVGVIVGVPTAIIAGPVFGAWISKRITVGVPEMMDEEGEELKKMDPASLPSFWVIFGFIAFPILLILTASICDSLVKAGSLEANDFIDVLFFLGHPIIALVLTTVIAMAYLGKSRGIDKSEMMEICTKALGPAGLIILITGAGGVFKAMLIKSNAAAGLAEALQNSEMPIIVAAYLLSVTVRVIQGSATVAMITAASLMAPMIEVLGLDPSGMDKALWVIAIAAGATILSHVNDSGFWLVSRYFGLTERQTFQSFTVMTTLISVVGFLLALLLSVFV